MNRYFLTVSTGIAVFLFSCMTSVKNESDQEPQNIAHQPADIYLQKNVKASVDSLFLLRDYAKNALSIGDSVGARIYYDKMYSFISEFSEDTKSVLLEWKAYDDLIHQLHSDMKKFMAAKNLILIFCLMKFPQPFFKPNQASTGLVK